MPGPLIGITTFRTTNNNGIPIISVAEAYVQALAQAGACPVLVPLGLDETRLRNITARLDGILFTGGGDVHPRRYGGQMNDLVSSVDEDRDRVEIELLHNTIETKLPFFGICRGLQLINVALGGDLYDDIRAQYPNSLPHDRFPEKSREFLAHPVDVSTGSRLAGILHLDQVQVNSMHHQGVRRLAPGLKASALAPDGIIEALEVPGYPFGLAVQWHPEWLQSHQEMRLLVEAFIKAAANKR